MGQGTKPTTFLDLFIGGVTLSEFLFSLFLVFFGVGMYFLVRIHNRQDKKSRLSFKIWWSNKKNILELIISLLMIYPMVRFAEVHEGWIMSMLPDTFKAVPYFIMLASGYMQHYILVKLFKATK